MDAKPLMGQNLIVLINLILVVELVRNSAACAGLSNRHHSRANRYTRALPLVYQERYPNAPELSMAASGPPRGRIHRGSDRFGILLPNYNDDILFKNEEGTMEDRIMSRRCMEKLDTLAVLVMSKWPGVRVRVTEAWDETGFHSMDSLHYEGRAVDITTSDRDRSKYGMLARLAVQSGFDYVYYESRAHVHASVKVDGDYSDRLRGCFHPSTNVTLSNGSHIQMQNLRIGDNVLAMRRDGAMVYSPIILFLDYSKQAPATYLGIRTESGNQLHLTPNHLIYHLAARPAQAADTPSYSAVSGPHSNRRFEVVYASALRVGDMILVTGNESSDEVSPITHIEIVEKRGFIAPLTSEGTIAVNGIVSSCYASTDNEKVAHSVFWPLRLFHRFQHSIIGSLIVRDKLINDAIPSDTIHWYPRILRWINSKIHYVQVL